MFGILYRLMQNPIGYWRMQYAGVRYAQTTSYGPRSSYSHFCPADIYHRLGEIGAQAVNRVMNAYHKNIGTLMEALSYVVNKPLYPNSDYQKPGYDHGYL